ncbi:NAD(P)/FAD-dependent oxidoreductase [Akkermansiaceae bacterium]|nr:NAD(P)/FAD-dependent oxidoreductase [Akkermansiaceae bacterium]MDB4322354.1 NAD(P)/FAD-dependent oxidoreductase [Akkermansiaceae bacterium]MDB4364127.1 NAD(P)/FAD-dependent oxidoreductase [Akkermansiaceae bacterium]
MAGIVELCGRDEEGVSIVKDGTLDLSEGCGEIFGRGEGVTLASWAEDDCDVAIYLKRGGGDLDCVGDYFERVIFGGVGFSVEGEGRIEGPTLETAIRRLYRMEGFCSTQAVHELVVIGGGAAGFYGAITAAEMGVPEVLILEKGPELLTKVRISGGGRCNVTHHCFDPKQLVESYPRGQKSLIGPFHRFQASDTVEWFESRGVELKVEADGRMFPVTDDSKTIIDCLTKAARDAGVEWRTRCGVESISKNEEGCFEVTTSGGEILHAQKILVATGGIRTKQARIPAEDFQHALDPAVPSLFTFKINDARLKDLPGVSVPNATVHAGKQVTTGPVLITHWGLSGPAILKASAWGARSLAEMDYQFGLRINWTGSETEESIASVFKNERHHHGSRKVQKRSLIDGITRRLWQSLCEAAGIVDEMIWAKLTRDQEKAFVAQLIDSRFEVLGKSINKDEFVTCGGVLLKDVNLKTMESKATPGLFFAGEVLDIDGVTGGFNFQAAWTTGHLAGMAISGMG